MPEHPEAARLRAKFKKFLRTSPEEFALMRREELEVNAYNHLHRRSYRQARTLSEIKREVPPKIVYIALTRLAAE